MIWPSSSCAFDLHLQSTVIISIVTSLTPWSPSSSWSSRQLLLLQLSLTHSDKVKQLHGVCISYNKATAIRLLPVADNFYKTWSSHTTIYISSRIDHITSQHALQKQVRRLCCKFYVAATGLARTILTYASKPQQWVIKFVVLTFNKDRLQSNSIQLT